MKISFIGGEHEDEEARLFWVNRGKVFLPTASLRTPVPAKAHCFSGPAIPNRKKDHLSKLGVFPVRYDQ
jgi:hypothetical protein